MYPVNVDNLNNYLTDFSNDNKVYIVFISCFDGGIISSNDINNSRIIAEVLSVIWKTFPDKDWRELNINWESSTVILINCDNFILGMQKKINEDTSFGMLIHKARIVSDYLKKEFQ